LLAKGESEITIKPESTLIWLFRDAENRDLKGCKSNVDMMAFYFPTGE